MGDKNFSVLVHAEGRRYLERDVIASSVPQLVRVLESRIGRRIANPAFFNPFANHYQPLTAYDFDAIPRNLELQVSLGEGGGPQQQKRGDTILQQHSGRPGVRAASGAARQSSRSLSEQGGGGRHPSAANTNMCPYCRNPQAKFCPETGKLHAAAEGHGTTSLEMRDGTHKMTFKSRAVEHIRNLALPLYNTGKITKEELVASCADVSEEFFHRRRVDEPEQMSLRRELVLEERDLLRVMVKAYHADQYAEGGAGGGAGQRRRNRTPSRREAAPPVEAARPARRFSPRRQRSMALTESRREAQGYHRSSPGGGGGFFDRSPSDGGGYSSYDQPPADSSPSPRRGGGGRRSTSPQRAGSPTGDGSLFTSVSYTVAGTFPDVPAHMSEMIGDNALRVSLQPPNLNDADQDVVVVGNLQSHSPVALCWWLAYGPQKIVLNLDRMYGSHFVTTYQISASSFILAFRAGSLVPGWEYLVHITVTSSTGTTSMSQTRFTVPTLAGANPPPAIGSRVHFNEMVRPSAASTPPRMQAAGYTGDSELGWLSRQQESTTGMLESGLGSVLDAASSSAGRVPSQIGASASVAALPMQSLPADSTHSQGRAAAAESQQGMGSTYHDALRHFFTTQIEPLYFLSPNPSMTEDQFRLVVKDVAKRYWLRYSPDTALSEDIKKSIVMDVKAEISKARTVVDATPTMSPYRSIR